MAISRQLILVDTSLRLPRQSLCSFLAMTTEKVHAKAPEKLRGFRVSLSAVAAAVGAVAAAGLALLAVLADLSACQRHGQQDHGP